MKRLFYYCLIPLILLITIEAKGQPFQGERAFQRFSTMKKLKMMEVLSLDEEKSDKFLAKYSSYDNKIFSIHNQIDQATRELMELMKQERVKSSDLKNKNVEIINLHSELSKTMGERYKEFQNILSDEELAKLILFERNFNNEVRKKIMEKGPKRGTPDEPQERPRRKKQK
ncbi:MAG TPA: hypothetical protein PLU67_06660 [Candidatus Kapabacteria bacterium]|jgi:hypothetical protein|nr:hypothetical protein [Candidatus Kapabacteria bacterium]HOM05156.1 hypothetical protein [Candidatus Kapabacteria bacterium]HOQ48299.1 hypothetical protein [Candidatus Kapabacteria bacterium]HPU23804.1 hypothetical protein [Candidatus Kapabacteria bacterium]